MHVASPARRAADPSGGAVGLDRRYERAPRARRDPLMFEQTYSIGLFGASGRGRQCLEQLAHHPRVKATTFFDNDPAKWNTTFDGLPVLAPTLENLQAVDVVVIASMHTHEIHEQLVQLGIGARIALSVPDLLRRVAADGRESHRVRHSAAPAAHVAEAAQRLLASLALDRAPAATSEPSSIAACTICANNYLPAARTLARSFLRVHPDARFIIGLVDRRSDALPYPDAVDPRIDVVEISALAIPDFESLAFRYDILELSCAVKPFLLEWILRRPGVERLLYLDPDILVLAPLHVLYDALAERSPLLTPHVTTAYRDDRYPSNADLLRIGAFNLGFIGLNAANADTAGFLEWWQDRLVHEGAADPAQGLFVDQKWIDHVPALFPDYGTARHPGANVAYWNLHEREVSFDGRAFNVNGAPLLFFHFSGYDPASPDCLSKYQNRHGLEEEGALRLLFEVYRLALADTGCSHARASVCHYSRFDNGVRIARILRQVFRQAGSHFFAGDPFCSSATDGFYEWLIRPSQPGSPLSNLFLAIHRTVKSLQLTFPDPDGVDRERFLEYLVAARHMYRLDDAFYAGIEVSSPVENAKRFPARRRASTLPRAKESEAGRLRVAGYLTGETGLGELARGAVRAARAAGYRVGPVTIDQPGARLQDDRAPSSEASEPWRGGVNLVVVNGDQVEQFVERAGEAFLANQFNIGYWAWELCDPPADWIHSARHFDEIWTPSSFTLDPISQLTSVPVVRMPPALDVHPAGRLTRHSLGLADETTVFLAMCDHRSFVERKNPLGAIEAFRRAFSRSEVAEGRVRLVVKTINGSTRSDKARLVEEAAAAAGAVILTEHFSRGETLDLIASADALISLHRSEGFGFPMAEAMWLGRAVIATGYSGNLDFMTPETAHLVRYRLARIERAVGPYPAGACWAEPDLDHAASLLREVANSRAKRLEMGRRAAAAVRASHGPEAVASLMSRRLALVTGDRGWLEASNHAPERDEEEARRAVSVALSGLPSSSSAVRPSTAGSAAAEPSQRVHVVLADRGWILERCGRELARRLSYVTFGDHPDPEAAVNYYVNYSAWRPGAPGRSAAFFTHIEERAPQAAARFTDVARRVDLAVCMSDRYAATLREAGVANVRVVTPGVDLSRFTPMVRIGVVGRTYHTGRKGEDLVRQVFDEPFVEWVFTGEGWPGPARHVADDDLPAFYRSLDYLLVPAHYEGGPMPVLEALACGVEVIAPDVGFVPDHPHLPFEVGNAEDLRRVLRTVVAERFRLRESVTSHSWERWAAEHDRLFRELIDKGAASAAPDGAAAVSVRAVEPSPAGPRVLLSLHAPEAASPGGPSIRVRRTQDALRALGVAADLTTDETPDPTGYDLVHVFNVWQPDSALDLLRHLAGFNVPVVFSPIYLDLVETAWVHQTVPSTFRDSRTRQELGRRLDEVLATPRARRLTPPFTRSIIRSDYPALVREMVSLADHLILLSDCERAHLERIGVGDTQWSLVRNGVDVELFATATPDLARDWLGVSEYVLCAGRIEPRKNQLLLTEALRETGLPIVFLGHGSNPSYADLVRRHGEDRVRIAGRVEHDNPLLPSIYAGARVFALPSWSEGAPLVALEAAAAGVPLVLSDRSGEREYFADLAEYCDPGDLSAIRAAVSRAWDGPRQSAAAQSRLQELVRDRFTWDHVARATRDVYVRVLAARASASRGEASDARARPVRALLPRRLEISGGGQRRAGYEHLDARAGGPDDRFARDFRLPLAFDDATFDEIHVHDCLEHTSSRALGAILRELARALKPGGTLELRLPDRGHPCRIYLGVNDVPMGDGAGDLSYMAARLLGADAGSSGTLAGRFAEEEGAQETRRLMVDYSILLPLLEQSGFACVERIEPFTELHVRAHRASSGVGLSVESTLTPAPTEPPQRQPELARWPAQPQVRWGSGVFNYSGYAGLCRQILRGLDRAHVPVQLDAFDERGAMWNELMQRPTDSRLWPRLLSQRIDNGVYVCCHTPTSWDGVEQFTSRRHANPGLHAYVGLTMFETDRVPTGWAGACESMDEIWVPSRFNLETFERGGVPAERIQVMPVGIEADRFAPGQARPLDIPGRRGFTFLSVFQWNLRKGWDVLLRAFTSAFRRDDDVCLVIRSVVTDGGPPLAVRIERFLREHRIAPSMAPAIVVLDRELSDDDMPRLYAAADAFVLPTRGEGWGLPFMEAMASGLPTIGTRWSAHLDFMNDENSFLIDVERLALVDPQHAIRNPFYAGQHRWAQPSVDHTAVLLREMYERPEEARRRGRRARHDIETFWPARRTSEWIARRTQQLMDANPEKTDRFAVEREARAHASAGRLDTAARMYEGLLAAEPNWMVVAYNLASIYQRRGESDPARELFDRVARRGATAALRGGAHFHLATLSGSDTQKTHLEACLREMPDHRGAQERLQTLSVQPAPPAVAVCDPIAR